MTSFRVFRNNLSIMTETRVKSKKKKSSPVYKKKLYQMSHMYRGQFNVLSSKKKSSLFIPRYRMYIETGGSVSYWLGSEILWAFCPVCYVLIISSDHIKGDLDGVMGAIDCQESISVLRLRQRTSLMCL